MLRLWLLGWAFFLCAPATAAGRPPSPGAAALQRAVDAAAKTGGVVAAPAGAVVDFGSSSLYVTNATGMTLDGRGVLLLFQPGHGVLVSGSRHTTIRNLSVDYDPPCFSQGVVTAFQPTPPTIRMRVSPGYPAPGASYIRSAAEIKVIFFSADGTRFSDGQPSADGLQLAVEVKATGEWNLTLPPFRGGFAPSLGSQVTVGPRIASAGWERPAPTSPFYDLGVGPTWASSTSWLVADSENVTSESVTLHGAGDMGFFESGGACGHTYRDITLTRAQSAHGSASGRAPGLLSSNIDGFHSWGCGRGPLLERSHLAHAGDDNVNIHGQLFVTTGALGGAKANASEHEIIVVDYGNAVYDPLGPRARMLSTMGEMAVGGALQFYSVEAPPVPVPPTGAATLGSANGGAQNVEVSSIVRLRDPAVVRAALNLTYALARPPYHVAIFPLIRPPFVSLPDYPLVFKVKLAGSAGQAVAAAVSSIAAAEQRFLWTQAPNHCGNGAVVQDNALSTVYDHIARVSSDGFVFSRNNVTCRQPGSDYAINVMCLPAWLQAKFGLTNLSFVNNTMKNCGLNTSAVFDTSPGQCTKEVSGLVVAGNKLL